jgi:hypothetical protein
MRLRLEQYLDRGARRTFLVTSEQSPKVYKQESIIKSYGKIKIIKTGPGMVENIIKTGPGQNQERAIQEIHQGRARRINSCDFSNYGIVDRYPIYVT